MSSRKPVLLCVTGLSPQVVTETLYTLIHRDPPFYPEAIHAITTGVGEDQLTESLQGAGNQIERLYQEYAPNQPVPELRIRTVRDDNGRALNDIQTEAENELFADHVMAVVRELASDEDVVIHASVAGGRKTMGVYVANAMAYLGRSHDEMSHVLVNPPFESQPEFFFKPKTPIEITDRDGKRHSTEDAQITLASIPFVPLRESHPKLIEQLTNIEQSVRYSRVVNQIRSTDKPASLTIRLHPDDLPLGDMRENVIHCNDIEFSFGSVAFLVFYTWLAERASVGADPIEPASDYRTMASELMSVIERAKLDGIPALHKMEWNLRQALEENDPKGLNKQREYVISRLKDYLRAELSGLADLFIPVSEGRPVSLHLPIEAENIHIEWPS